MTSPQHDPARAREMPPHWRMLAGLLPSPGELTALIQGESFEACRLAWDLTSTILQGSALEYSTPGQPGFASYWLGQAGSLRYSERLVGKVIVDMRLLGWQLVYDIDKPSPNRRLSQHGTSEVHGQPDIRIARLWLQRSKYEAAFPGDEAPLPSLWPSGRFVPSVDDVDRLTHTFGNDPVFRLVWMLMQSEMAGKNGNLASFSSMMYSEEDWQGAEEIFASRGWTVITMPFGADICAYIGAAFKPISVSTPESDARLEPWSGGEMPLAWRIGADLVLTPRELRVCDEAAFGPLIDLAWELTGNLLLGHDEHTMRFPWCCLGAAGEVPELRQTLEEMSLLARQRGWCLDVSAEPSEKAGEWWILPGKNLPGYASGRRLVTVRLKRRDKERERFGEPGWAKALPSGLVPPAALFQTLSEVGGPEQLSTLRLLWLIMRLVYCREKVDGRVKESMFTDADWRGIEAIVSMRGWKLCTERTTGNVEAWLEEIPGFETGTP